MSKIILGTVQFGLNYGINNKTGKPNLNEVKSILDYAYKKNIIYLDTAEAYGNSHEIIGSYHEYSKNKFNVITKFCPDRIDLPINISERINHNLKILNVNNLYSFMFHSYDDYKKYFKLFRRELLDLKSRGIIKKIGVSLHYNKNIYDILQNEEIDLIQLPYNLLDNKSKREKVFSEAKEKGIEIHTRSTFLQGLFFKDLNEINGKLISLKKYLLELKKIATKNEIYSLAINYVCSNSSIDGILLGVDSVEHLKKNLSCINNNNLNDILKRIDSINVSEEELLNPANW